MALRKFLQYIVYTTKYCKITYVFWHYYFCLKQSVPFQVYPANSTMLISYILGYTEDTLRRLREEIMELALEQYHFIFPGKRVGTKQ